MAYILKTTANTLMTTNASFQQFGSTLSYGLANCGLILTANNTDWSTANTSNGPWEIWRFNDTLQNTSPVFFKIWYAASPWSGPSLTIQFGVSANSSALTGNIVANGGFYCSGGDAGYYTQPFILSGDTNRFMFSSGCSGAGGSNGPTGIPYQSLSIGAERSVDANGNMTGEATLLLGLVGTSPSWYESIGIPNVSTTWIAGLPACAPIVGANGVFAHSGMNWAASSLSVFPIFHSYGKFYPAGLNALAYYTNDIPTEQRVTITRYGVNHTYIALGVTANATCRLGAATRTSLLQRFD